MNWEREHERERARERTSRKEYYNGSGESGSATVSQWGMERRQGPISPRKALQISYSWASELRDHQESALRVPHVTSDCQKELKLINPSSFMIIARIEHRILCGELALIFSMSLVICLMQAGLLHFAPTVLYSTVLFSEAGSTEVKILYRPLGW